IILPFTTASSEKFSTQIVTTIQTAYTSSSALLPSQCPQDKSIVIGASVGATLGSAFVASLLALWFVLWRKHKRQTQSQSPYGVTSQVEPVIGSIGPAEMESIPARYSNSRDIDFPVQVF